MIESLTITFFLSYLITHFEPIQWLIELIDNKTIKSILYLILTCLKCVSFWVCLLYTGNIFYASIAFFIGFWWDRLIGPKEKEIKF